MKIRTDISSFDHLIQVIRCGQASECTMNGKPITRAQEILAAENRLELLDPWIEDLTEELTTQGEMDPKKRAGIEGQLREKTQEQTFWKSVVEGNSAAAAEDAERHNTVSSSVSPTVIESNQAVLKRLAAGDWKPPYKPIADTAETQSKLAEWQDLSLREGRGEVPRGSASKFFSKHKAEIKRDHVGSTPGGRVTPGGNYSRRP